MKGLLPSYLAVAATVAGLDLLWLGVLAKDYYRAGVGPLMADKVRWEAAALFYAVYAAGILYFAIHPGIERGSPARAAANGALLGLLVYSVYDLTNLALLRGWPAGLSLVDVLWGTALTACAAWVGFLAYRA